MSSAAASYTTIGAADITRLIRERQMSCVEVAGAANRAITKLDGPIHSFATAPGDDAIERAAELDRKSVV